MSVLFEFEVSISALGDKMASLRVQGESKSSFPKRPQGGSATDRKPSSRGGQRVSSGANAVLSSNNHHEFGGDDPISNQLSHQRGLVAAGSNPQDDTMVIRRTTDQRQANPDRLNLDRRGLLGCPILFNEEQLRLLNYQHNQIRKIENLQNLRRLIFLDLYDNQINRIANLDSLQSLRVLMLGKNKIRRIENLAALAKLDVLDLHANEISSIENIGHLSELRVLNLAGNRIDTVYGLRGLQCLTELNLRRNEIKHVSEIEFLPSLQRLFLSFNNISSLHNISCLANSISLAELTLDNNPIHAEPKYRSSAIVFIPQLRQLDMKRIVDDERRLAQMGARREEEKSKYQQKVDQIGRERQRTIQNARRHWQIANNDPIPSSSGKATPPADATSSTQASRGNYISTGGGGYPKPNSHHRIHRRPHSAKFSLSSRRTDDAHDDIDSFSADEGGSGGAGVDSRGATGQTILPSNGGALPTISTTAAPRQDEAELTSSSTVSLNQTATASAGTEHRVHHVVSVGERSSSAFDLTQPQHQHLSNRSHDSGGGDAPAAALATLQAEGKVPPDFIASKASSSHSQVASKTDMLTGVAPGAVEHRERGVVAKVAPLDRNATMERFLGDVSKKLAEATHARVSKARAAIKKEPTILDDNTACLVGDNSTNLAELKDGKLCFYGAGSLESYERGWTGLASGVQALQFTYCEFSIIAPHLPKLKTRFPNATKLIFDECNIATLAQLAQIAASHRRIEFLHIDYLAHYQFVVQLQCKVAFVGSLTIAGEGNPVVVLNLFRPFVLFHFAGVGLRYLNEQEISERETQAACSMFSCLASELIEQAGPDLLTATCGEAHAHSVKAAYERRVDRSTAEMLARSLLSSAHNPLPSYEENRRHAAVIVANLSQKACLRQSRVAALDACLDRVLTTVLSEQLKKLEDATALSNECKAKIREFTP